MSPMFGMVAGEGQTKTSVRYSPESAIKRTLETSLLANDAVVAMVFMRDTHASSVALFETAQ